MVRSSHERRRWVHVKSGRRGTREGGWLVIVVAVSMVTIRTIRGDGDALLSIVERGVEGVWTTTSTTTTIPSRCHNNLVASTPLHSTYTIHTHPPTMILIAAGIPQIHKHTRLHHSPTHVNPPPSLFRGETDLRLRRLYLLWRDAPHLYFGDTARLTVQYLQYPTLFPLSIGRATPCCGDTNSHTLSGKDKTNLYSTETIHHTLSGRDNPTKLPSV